MAPWSLTWMEAFPRHGNHNLTEPCALSRTHIPEASTVHQTKAVGHLDVNHSLRFFNIKLTDAEGGLTGAPGGRAADVIG